MMSRTEGRSSSSSHSSLENEQPKVKQATLSPTPCCFVEKPTNKRCVCGSGVRETETDWSRRSRHGIACSVEDTCSTVRWKLADDDRAVEQYKAERRRRYEEDIVQRRLSLTLRKAEQ